MKKIKISNKLISVFFICIAFIVMFNSCRIFFINYHNVENVMGKM